ncbi:MAG: HAMP domain-containing histidine kinase [Bacteroidales bacterium]|nr:HAMP domain-containing histidine kinase [Bacteroidales bacterium]
MENLLLIIIGILLLIIFVLAAKVYFLRKSAQEIAEAFRDRLTADTNTLIDISTRDPYMRKLAADINEQLRILRKQRHKYLNGDRELKEAVTNISHDLRTPLTAICGYLDLLQKEDKSEDAARYLSLVENRVEAMKQLTEELFRYSVILSTEEMIMETVHVNGVLEESIAAFYGALTSRGIQPRIHMSGKRIEKQLNRDALARVFSNILNNALKYSDGDLEITLHDDGEIVFSNTASGLNEVQVGKLFDRFFTVEAARNSNGLGLAISKTLVEQMGGSITASLSDGRLHISIKWK